LVYFLLQVLQACSTIKKTQYKKKVSFNPNNTFFIKD